MRKTLSATVVGIDETDTSCFVAGAHAVTLDVFADGLPAKRIRVPLFSVEEAKDLGRLYRERGGVRITIETVSDNVREGEHAASGSRQTGTVAEKPETPPRRSMSGVEGPFRISGVAPGSLVETLVGGLAVKSDRLVGEQWAEVIWLANGAAGNLHASSLVKVHPAPGTDPPAPLIVNGKPSCCEAAKVSPLHMTNFGVAAHELQANMMWAIGAHVGIDYCPYCGTKLPALDGAPA